VAASLLALAVASVTCGGGKKNSGDATGGRTVYIAGESNNRAILWKNSAAQQLSGTEYRGYAASVFVSGSDVYAAGGEYTGELLYPSTVSPVQWKNGARQELSATGNYSWVNSVFVSGGDVYVAGRDGIQWVGEGEGYYRRAMLWKNGTQQQLSSTALYTFANSVYVVGSDVYVTGDEYHTNDPEVPKAVFWKNGVRQQLSSNAEAFSVFVK